MKNLKTIIIFIIVVGVIIYGILALWDKFFVTSVGSGSNYNSAFDTEQQQEEENREELNYIENQTAGGSGSSNSDNDDEENSDDDNEEDEEDSEENPVSNYENEEDKICNEKCSDKSGEDRNNCLIECRNELEEENDVDDCDSLLGEAKYKCVRNKAIDELDASICEDLEAGEYRTKCDNAVTEAIFDQM